MPRMNEKAKQADRTQHRYKEVGRQCKWCERTDREVECGFVSNQECMKCYCQRKRSSCTRCKGPWYVKGGCLRRSSLPFGVMCRPES